LTISQDKVAAQIREVGK